MLVRGKADSRVSLECFSEFRDVVFEDVVFDNNDTNHSSVTPH